MKPITPSEVTERKAQIIPEKVIAVWNDLIAVEMAGGNATILQDDAVLGITVAMNCTRQDVFDNKWLDIEDIYEEAGWNVNYDKPGYNESYPATFTFTAKG